MATKYPELWTDLAAPFQGAEVKSKPAGRAGGQLHYITARTAMNRLDEVLGPENWWDHYLPSDHSVVCRLTVKLPDGTELTKEDVGGYAGMEVRNRIGEMVRDDENDEKSGFSDAFKRAAAKFGVGRYLYRDGVPNFAAPSHAGHAAPAPSKAPTDAPWESPADRNGSSQRGEPRQSSGPPRSGRALFAWVKQMEEQTDCKLLEYLNKWGKLQELPGRMVDWDEDTVAKAHVEAVRKLQGIGVTVEGGDGLKRLRKELVDAVVGLFRSRNDTDREPSKDEFFAIMDEFSERCDGEVISSVSGCDDPALLGKYARAVRDAATVESGI